MIVQSAARLLSGLVITIGFAAAPTLAQTTWYVDDDAPSDPAPGDPAVSDPLENGSAGHPFDAIQEGIDAAVNGDTVVVADGTYTGDGNRDLDYGGRLITVRSENGSENCIIDCQFAGRGFYFHRGETAEAVIEGFTVTNGYVDNSGGGILCDDSSGPMIVACLLTFNFAAAGGGLMCDHGSSPLIVDCAINDNHARDWGGGIYCMRSSSPLILNSQISDNVAFRVGGGGISCFIESSPLIVNTTFLRNVAGGGGAIACNAYSSPTIVNCTVAANAAMGVDALGGGLLVGGFGGSVGFPTLVNSILWGNTAANGPQIAIGWDYANVELTVSYCDIEGGEAAVHVGGGVLQWGPGNIGADPLFVDPTSGDYRLSPTSPCIDAASNTALPNDLLDLDCDGDPNEPSPFDLDWRLRFADRISTYDTGLPHPDYPSLPIVDMGAYEYQCDGDLDGDGEVALSDLAQLLGSYGMTSGAAYEDGDLDGDGDVDLADLATLLGVYGTICS